MSSSARPGAPIRKQPTDNQPAGVSNDAEAFNWAVDAALGDKNVYGLVIKLESNPSVFQYSNPFKIAGSKKPAEKPAAEKPAAEKPAPAKPGYDAPSYGDEGTSTLTAHYGSKTVSVSPVYNPPHPTAPVEKPVTVPCENSTAPATTFVPVVKTTSVPCNGTATVPVSPPVYTHPGSNPPAQSHPVNPGHPVYPTQPAGVPPHAGTPTPVPVSGAARFGAPVAIVAGLVMAAFAL